MDSYLGSRSGRIGGIHTRRREKRVPSPYSVLLWTHIHHLSLPYSMALPTSQQQWKAESVTYPWACRCWICMSQQKRPTRVTTKGKCYSQALTTPPDVGRGRRHSCLLPRGLGKAVSSPAHWLAAWQRATFLLELPLLHHCME